MGVSASADPALARPVEVPGPAALVEDRPEGKEHQEFEGLQTSYLIGVAVGSGCTNLARPPQARPKYSLNGPERKLFSRFNAGILKVDKIKVPIVTRTHERFVLAEKKGVVGASIFRESDSNDDAILLALPVDGKNFCGNGGQSCFLPLTHAGNADPVRSIRSSQVQRDITRSFQVVTDNNCVPVEYRPCRCDQSIG
jgi:hypothetical protein